jgi:TPR repeat protein
VLAKKFGYEVVPLIGPTATKAAIEASIRKYGQELGDRDALIVFFAGHGQVVELSGHSEAGYLVPADARLDLNDRTDAARWADQALDMQHLTDLMEQATAQHVLFIADACCSGFMTKRGSLERWDLKSFLAGKSRTVLTATTRRQLARENPSDQHGYFTAALLNELRKDDAASVLDAYYLLLKVVAGKTNGTMTPQLAQVGDGDGMFVFVPLTIPKDEIENDLNDQAPPPAVGRNRGLAGVAGRAAFLAQQRTKPKELYTILETADYRLADNAEDRKRDWEQRFERYQRNALAGDVWAMAALCLCFEKGLGVDKDPNQAYRWAKEADRARRPAGVGRYLLGRCYERGLGVALSGPGAKELSLQLYRESAAAGAELGRYGVALRLLADAPSRETASQARRQLEQLVAEGVLVAEYSLALEVLQSRPGLPRDLKRTLSLLNNAAERGNARAHWILGEIYWTGGDEFPAVDLKKAEFHLRQACAHGSADATTALAQMYRDGPKGALKFSTDYSRAFELYDRAAQSGHPVALVESARMLADGNGTKQNHALAKERIEAAIRAGNPWGDFIQGLWHLDGRVLQQDSQKALVAFKRAADAGHAEACFMAGQMYCQGRGFELRRRWEGVTAYHLDWYVGLHYLTRAQELKVEGNDELHEFLVSTLRAFTAALACSELGFFANDGMREENARKLGFLPFCFAAGAVAEDWRKLHPDSFAWYCKKADLDPITLKPLKNEGKKPSEK